MQEAEFKASNFTFDVSKLFFSGMFTVSQLVYSNLCNSMHAEIKNLLFGEARVNVTGSDMAGS